MKDLCDALRQSISRDCKSINGVGSEEERTVGGGSAQCGVWRVSKCRQLFSVMQKVKPTTDVAYIACPAYAL